jgi:hypothetical protein
VLRTAQDIFALDNAFSLIEGHPFTTWTAVDKQNPDIPE